MIDIQAKFSQAFTDLGDLGRSGENEARRIVFDCADALTEYPSANILCIVKRPCDIKPYTVTLTADGTNRALILTNAETAAAGQVMIELRALQGDAILKSAIFAGKVIGSLRGEADEPAQPVRDVLDRVDAVLEDATATRDALLTALDGVDDAVSSATTAADTANTAATNADTKASAANTAAEKAQNAADRANASASSADTATANAQTATASAETATKNANTATQNAQNATADAKTATGNANTAAESANTAAGKATAAADAANSAASGANTATVNANTATTNADNAASNANAKATAADTAATNATDAAAKANTAAANAQSVADDVQAKADSGAFNGKVQDVQLNGKSILTDGIATIPVYTERVSNAVCGIYKVRSNDGTTGVSLIDGALGINPAGTTRIKERSGNMAIATKGYDYAVKCAMTDGVGAAWTLDEQKAARQRMGLDGEYKLVEKIELTNDTTTQIIRASKPDGTAYSLRKIFTQAYAKLVSGSGAWGIEGVYTRGGTFRPAVAFGGGDIGSTTFTTCYMEVWVENGIVHCRSGIRNHYYAVSYDAPFSFGVASDTWLTVGDVFTGFRIDQFNSKAFASGTTFWIYGVDA